jgi:hypothetical protein
MKQDNNPEMIKDLENKLGKLSKVTLSREFPSWETLSKQEIKYPSLVEVPKLRTNLLHFPKKQKVWIGTGLLAAASLSIVFLLSRFTAPDSPQGLEVASTSVPSPRSLSYEPLLGAVSHTKGKNFLQEGSSEPAVLSTQSEIKVGNRILVGKAGTLDIIFPNKVYVRVLSETEIEIVDSKSSVDASLQLIRIWKGKVLVTLGKLKKDSSFQIASGNVDTTVRGTTFSVSYDGKAAQSVAVREGSVVVKTGEHPETVLEPGKQILISDNLPSEVIAIQSKDDKEMKALQTQVTLSRESKLYEEYSRLELVRMEDGTEYHGVIMGQTATHLQLESIDGTLEIPIGKILETEKIR